MGWLVAPTVVHPRSIGPPAARFPHAGEKELECQFMAGCDGELNKRGQKRTAAQGGIPKLQHRFAKQSAHEGSLHLRVFLEAEKTSASQAEGISSRLGGCVQSHIALRRRMIIQVYCKVRATFELNCPAKGGKQF